MKDTVSSAGSDNVWEDVDTWVDDDFDATELFQKGQQSDGDNEDDWDDTSDEGENDKFVSTKEPQKWQRGSNLQVSKFTDSKKDRFDKHNLKRASHTQRRDREERGWKDKPVRNGTYYHRGENNGRHSDHAHYQRNGYQRTHYQEKYDDEEGEEREEAEADDDADNGSGHLNPLAVRLGLVGANNDKPKGSPFKKTRNTDGQVDEISDSLSKLMSVNKKFHNHNDEPEDVSKHTHSNGRKNTHKDRSRNSEQIQSSNPPQRYSKSHHDNSRSDSHTTRIHYTDEKDKIIPKAPASMLNQANNKDMIPKPKKTAIFESRWAAADDSPEKNNSTKDSITASREYYRKQKLANQLDWDNGIEGFNDYNTSDSEEEIKPASNTTTTHEHFSYDNSGKTNSEPKIKPKIKEKPKPSKELTSMWA